MRVVAFDGAVSNTMIEMAASSDYITFSNRDRQTRPGERS